MLLSYWIHYPKPWQNDALTDTDVECISLDIGPVDQKYYERTENGYLEDLDHCSGTCNGPWNITGDSAWIMFNYDCDKPDTSRIMFAGNNLQECLSWWNKHWKEYVNDEDLVYKIPSFEHFTGDEDLVWEGYYHGVRIKKMQLI